MDMFDLAGTLFGNRRDTVAQGSTLTATGSTASADGVAGIVIDADVTPAEGIGDEDVDQTIIDLPTSPDVAEGDEVIVTLVGDGPLKTPIVTANPGSGDRMAAAVSNAETLAEQAEAVASATGQHFWPDTDGVHVTEVTQDEWNDSTSPDYHSGANVLLNALGQLFRDGLNNLLAIVAGRAYSDTFEVVDVYAEGLTCDLTAAPLGGEGGLTVTSSAGDLTDADWWYDSYAQQVKVVDNYTSHHLHAVITVAYRSTPGTAIYDGQGNAASNILAEFTSNLVRIGGRLASVGESTAKVQFFESTSDTALTATHYVYDTSQGYDPTVSDNVALGTTVNDTALATGEGRSARSYLNLYGSLYNDGSSYSDAAEASIVVGNISPDEGRMANKTAIWARTLDYSGATKREIGLSAGRLVLSTESYTPGDEVGTNISMRQAIVGLTQPGGTWTGANNTATDGSNAWRVCTFNTYITRTGAWSGYFTISGGTITALKDVVLEISGNMYWNSGPVAQYGFGLFTGGTFDSNGYMTNGTGEISNFNYKGVANGQFSVPFPPRFVHLTAGSHLYICRYTHSGAVYRNGNNMTYITIKVIEDRSS